MHEFEGLSNIFEKNKLYVESHFLTSHRIAFIEYLKPYVLMFYQCNKRIECKIPDIVSKRSLQYINLSDVFISWFYSNYEPIVITHEYEDVEDNNQIKCKIRSTDQCVQIKDIYEHFRYSEDYKESLTKAQKRTMKRDFIIDKIRSDVQLKMFYKELHQPYHTYSDGTSTQKKYRNCLVRWRLKMFDSDSDNSD